MKLKNVKIRYNTGFGNNIFLTEEEWNTFRKRKPVRYIKKHHDSMCYVCGKPGTSENPLQHSHVIGFELGIIYLALTPDYLDSHSNIKSAHRKSCNASCEKSIFESIKLLKEKGIISLPEYLPKEILDIWENS